MNVLVVSHFYRPDITAAAFRTSALVDGLRSNGHHVEVITGRPHKVQAVSASTETAVHRLRTFPAGRSSVSYIAHYLGFAVLAAGRSMFKLEVKPDVVFVTSPPLFVAPAAVAAARRYRASLVLEVRDIWPDSAVAIGQIGPDGLAFRVGKRLESWAYSQADAIVAVAKPMAAELATRTSVPISVAYNGVEVESLPEAGDDDQTSDPGVRVESQPQPGDNLDQTSAPSIDAGKIMAYVGNIGRAQSLDRLVDAFVDAQEQGHLPGWRLLLVGEGTERDRLSSAWAHTESVSFPGPVDQQRAAAIMSEATVLLLALTSDPTFDLTIPSKVFDYLNAGRPILAALRGEGAEILGETGANIVVDPDDDAALLRSLATLDERLGDLERVLDRNVEMVRTRFTRAVAVARIEEALVGTVPGT